MWPSPMPGELDVRQAFAEKLDPRLSKLLETVFDGMNLAGEAGYLLRIAEQVRESIRQIYGNVGGLFAQAEKSEWAKAGQELRTALEAFATSSRRRSVLCYAALRRGRRPRSRLRRCVQPAL